MGEKEKNRFDGMKRRDLLNFLMDADSIVQNARNYEDLENIKRDLIKSYKPMKNDPSLQKLNEERIRLLKLSNLNLQFLHRVHDARRMMAQLNVKGAYDEMVEASKSMYNHPDRSYLLDWIRIQIRETLEHVADKAAEEERQAKKRKDHRRQILTSQVQKLKNPNQTFIPGSGNPKIATDDLKEKDQFQTFRPQPSYSVNTQEKSSPFDLPSSANNMGKNEMNFKTSSAESTNQTIKPPVSGEIPEFPAPNPSPFQPNEESKKSPFPSSKSSSMNSPFDDPSLRKTKSNTEKSDLAENSIKTYWKRNDEDGEEK